MKTVVRTTTLALAAALLTTGCAPPEEECFRPGQMTGHLLDVEGADADVGDLLVHGTIASPERYAIVDVQVQIASRWDVFVDAWPDDGVDLRRWTARVDESLVAEYGEDGELELAAWAVDRCMEERGLDAVPVLGAEATVLVDRAPDPEDLAAEDVQLDVVVEWPVSPDDEDGLAPPYLAEDTVAPLVLTAGVEATGVEVSLTIAGGGSVSPSVVTLLDDGAGAATATALVEVGGEGDLQLLATAGPHTSLIDIPVRAGPVFTPGDDLTIAVGDTVQVEVLPNTPARVHDCSAWSATEGVGVLTVDGLFDLVDATWRMGADGGALRVFGPDSETGYEVVVTCTDDRAQPSELVVRFASP